jgi:pimeloyl-ACP methyl ester carboxylesterase
MAIMQKDYVVLLHGMAVNSLYMLRLEKALSKEGYQIINMDYPSRKSTISDISNMIFKKLNLINKESNLKVHFVGFSMGCLVIRELLGKNELPNVGNIVLIGPPNHGSQVSDFLVNNIFYKAFFGPAGQQLTTNFAKNNPFPSLQHTFGIIAGNVCLDPFSYFILPKENDGKITVESTKLEGMKDHIIIPISHTLMVFSNEVIKQVIYFLKYSHFKHQV